MTIKKLLYANNQLREDLTKEIERYHLLESKYKDLLVKHSLVNKQNQKNENIIFGMNTGADFSNQKDYLSKKTDNELDQSLNKLNELNY